MFDIFISYAREDEEVVKRLAAALELQGWSVFWDRTIPAGETWRSHIEKALEEARCVVVAWSVDSIESHWVQEEADDARMRNVLIPVLLAPISPPIGFRSITAANLSGWNGSAEDEFFLQFRADISRKLGDPPALTEAREHQRAEEKRKAAELLEKQRAEEKQKAAVQLEKKQATEIRKTAEQIEKQHSTATSQAEKPTAKKQPETLRIARNRKPLLYTAIALSIITAIAWTSGIQLPQNGYELTVIATPPGASIEIQDVGRYTLGMQLEAGTYTIHATSPGYQAEERVFEVAERDVKLNLKLQPTLPLPQLVRIPAGSFIMGSEDGGSSEQPIRAVHIEQPFYLGKTEVTFDEYDAFAEATGRNLPPDRDWGRGNHPVINVSWDDARAYAAWLDALTGSQCRLPSEAEWEYAARAGTKTRYALPAPEGSDDLSGYANCYGCGSSEQVADEYQEQIGQQTLPVESFPANAWGLHDMHGNVWEWVADCGPSSYEGAPDDGRAWLAENGGSCSRRVLRGGSWDHFQGNARSALRSGNAPGDRNGSIGFRVLCSSPI